MKNAAGRASSATQSSGVSGNMRRYLAACARLEERCRFYQSPRAMHS